MPTAGVTGLQQQGRHLAEKQACFAHSRLGVRSVAHTMQTLNQNLPCTCVIQPHIFTSRPVPRPPLSSYTEHATLTPCVPHLSPFDVTRAEGIRHQQPAAHLTADYHLTSRPCSCPCPCCWKQGAAHMELNDPARLLLSQHEHTLVVVERRGCNTGNTASHNCGNPCRTEDVHDSYTPMCNRLDAASWNHDVCQHTCDSNCLHHTYIHPQALAHTQVTHSPAQPRCL